MKSKFRIVMIAPEGSEPYYEIQQRVLFFFWETMEICNKLEYAKSRVINQYLNKPHREVVYEK